MKPLPYNSRNCPVTLTVRVMGKRWKPLVLYYLKDEPKRFNELRRLLPEATQKMMTQTLREMEADGLVRRTVYEQVPPKVVYSLTRYGRSLDPILHALAAWGDKHSKARAKRSGKNAPA